MRPKPLKGKVIYCSVNGNESFILKTIRRLNDWLKTTFKQKELFNNFQLHMKHSPETVDCFYKR